MATDVEISGGPVVSSQEPSYYEIALTNRQVVVAFVILLTCLLAAFFAGVWIGRESGARAQERLAQAAVTAPAAPREGQALEEFQFFKEGDGKKGKKGKTEPAPAAPATDAGAGTAGSEAMPKGSPLEEPPPAATPGRPALFTEREPAAQTPPPVPPVASPSPVPVDRKPTAAKPATPAKPTPAAPDRLAQGGPAAQPPAAKGKAAAEAPVPAAGKLIIQVFSSPDKDQADKIKAQLVASGQKAFLSPIRSGAGRTMYRVRIGPFDSRDKAEKVANQVRKEQRLDTWITPN